MTVAPLPAGRARRSRTLTTALIAVSALIGTGALTGASPVDAVGSATAPAFTEGFEGGVLPEGWRVASGAFGQLVTDRARFHNSDAPYLKEGTWFLSTLETAGQQPSDSYTGTVVSPKFTLARPTVTMLVGGGSGANTYVALCAYDATAADGCGKEVARASGADSEVMAYRTLDGSSLVGKDVVLKVVDKSTAAWGHVTLDDVRANVPPAPTAPRTTRTADAVSLTWQAAPDPQVTGYEVYRSTAQDGAYTKVATVKSPSYQDRSAGKEGTWFYRVVALDADGGESEPVTTLARPYTDLSGKGAPATYSGDHLTDTRFPVGPLGSAGIVHDGTGARPTWWIFNNIGKLSPGSWQLDEDTYTQGKLPNSFFGVRAQAQGGRPVVRALQTKAVGDTAFPAMKSLTQQGEYPQLGYDFKDDQLPVRVSEDVVNPMIPGDAKDSAIPTAIYRFTLDNPTRKPVKVSLLASQQNAVGFNGYDTVGGADDRVVDGYGANRTRVTAASGAQGPQTGLSMSGKDGAGTMNLTAYGKNVSATASWDSLSSLSADLADDGKLSGSKDASSPADRTTVDGALSVSVTLEPGGHTTVPIALNWHFPGAKNYNGGDGRQYENWWNSADDVSSYVTRNYDRLLADTTAYHDSLYDSNLPRYLIDRVSAATAVLHSPSVWWAKNGFFGAREGWGCCPGMPTHVFHYAQAQAWLWPEVGRRWTQQWLDNADSSGKIPMRFDGDSSFTMDGQTGVLLSAYRTYQTTDKKWLDANWAKVEKSMDYVVGLGDADHDGILTGSFNTTLDGGETGNGSWLGSMYLASVHASQKMAEAEGDTKAAQLYASIYEKGRTAGEKAYFNGEYYTEVNSGVGASYGNGSEVDMLLGQWWSTQLGLGDIYDSAHMDLAAKNLFKNNYRDNLLGDTPYSGYNYAHQFRQYALETDGGLQMTTWPHGDKPSNTPLYYDELMSGFEYSAAALMLQRGQTAEGLRAVKAISDRYDGKARKGPYISMGTCSTGDGTGSPFGDDECGKYYGRTLSSWSLLTAAQGFSSNGPEGALTFAPTWRPADHRSFFSTGAAWGTFTQKRAGGVQTDSVLVRHGSLAVRRLTLQVPQGTRTVRLRTSGSAGELRGAEVTLSGTTATVRFAKPLTVRHAPLTVRLAYGP
ncbi:GH116 family glycosyl-hydrolase [Streptomyces sp. NBC_01267]|uniref:GH116 family glycosyl-hydrolase n=1 Tax=Streptomyces sp. NBC_01267 TaxID=2903805 RepID=UPI002E2EEBE5|nr:GH116 family glycosyl-hydrolase [Streptomyces sp. NBC_01267]